jgi:hypothetical protein
MCVCVPVTTRIGGKDCWRPKTVCATSNSTIGCCRALQQSNSTGSYYDDDVSDDDRGNYGDNDHRNEDSIQKRKSLWYYCGIATA